MPGGRPSVIDAQIGTRPEDGAPITVADRILSALRAGAYFEHAAAQAGIPKETAYGWLRTAGRIKRDTRGKPTSELEGLTPHELRCCEFSDSVAEAESSWEVGALATLERLARGGLQIRKTVTKRGPAITLDADGTTVPGPILEQTETVETLAPNAQVLEWRLARRFPGRYGQRVEVTGADGGPLAVSLEERADQLVGHLESYLEGVAAAEQAKPARKPRARKKAAASGADPPGSP